jgi:hypothetical protein
MGQEINTTGSLLGKLMAWFIVIVLKLLVVTGFVRFLPHRDLFVADAQGVAGIFGTVFGGFWIRLSVQVPSHMATLMVGLLALVVGVLGWNQKRNADRKSEWWRRAQYAIDLTLAEERNKAIAGFSILGHVGTSTERAFPLFRLRPIGDADDQRLFRTISDELKRYSIPMATLGG